MLWERGWVATWGVGRLRETCVLVQEQEGRAVCAPRRCVVGSGRRGGPGIRGPWGREVRGAWHPWTLAAESRVLGCGAVFPSLQVVGQEISLGGQQRFLSEPSRIK